MTEKWCINQNQTDANEYGMSKSEPKTSMFLFSMGSMISNLYVFKTYFKYVSEIWRIKIKKSA